MKPNVVDEADEADEAEGADVTDEVVEGFHAALKDFKANGSF